MTKPYVVLGRCVVQVGSGLNRLNCVQHLCGKFCSTWMVSVVSQAIKSLLENGLCGYDWNP